MTEPKFSLKQEVYWVTTNEESQKQMHVGNISSITKTGTDFDYTVRDILNNAHTIAENDLLESRESAAEIFNQ